MEEWFAPTEGILVNNAGSTVDGVLTGEHLFGDMGGTYADGFEKLALLDANHDGQVAGAELRVCRSGPTRTPTDASIQAS